MWQPQHLNWGLCNIRMNFKGLERSWLKLVWDLGTTAMALVTVDAIRVLRMSRFYGGGHFTCNVWTTKNQWHIKMHNNQKNTVQSATRTSSVTTHELQRESGWWSFLWAVSSPGAPTWSPSGTNYLRQSAHCKTHTAMHMNTILLKIPI